MAVTINGNGTITGSSNTLLTGQFDYFARANAPTGWIAGNGQTMGATGSGATVTGTIYFDLFSAWWLDYSDALVPLLTSTGAASTRGASAVADWNALKRMTVFDMRDYFVRGASATNLNGNRYADDLKGHTHGVNITASTGGSVARFTGYAGNDGSQAVFTTSTGGTETRPMNIPFLPCFKL